MKRMLLLSLVTGFLLLGTLSVIEETSESSLEEIVDFSDDNFGEGIGDPVPDGEGPGGGAGNPPG